MQRILCFAGRTAVACAFMGVAGCASIAPVSINSYPDSANVEIKRSDGTVVAQSQPPMTIELKEGKDYIITVSLDGFEPQSVPISNGSSCGEEESSGEGEEECSGLPLFASRRRYVLLLIASGGF